MIPFKVKLEISDFQRVTAAVFGQTACKVRDRVNKLVRYVEQQLGEHRVREHSRVGCDEEYGGSHLLHLARSLHLDQCSIPNLEWTSACSDPPESFSFEVHDCRQGSTSLLFL